MPTPFTLAAVQLAPRIGAFELNADAILRCIRERDERVLVFPELATSGYHLEDRAAAKAAAVAPDHGLFARVREALGPERAAVIGFAEAGGRYVYNSAILIAPGRAPVVYRKMHLFARETELFDAGDGPAPVVELGFANIGVMICYDWCFPEVARSLALTGADVIAHPANLVMPFWPTMMPLRAFENGVYIATADRFGEETAAGTTLRFQGKSRIVGPRGEFLSFAPDHAEGVATATIDPFAARDKDINPYNHMFAARRPEFYGRLTDPRGYRPNVCAVVTSEAHPGLILCGERIDLPGAWQLPQGGVEADESPEDAVIRESCEELGCTPDDLTILRRGPRPVRYDFPQTLEIETKIAKRWRGQAQWWFELALRPGAVCRPAETDDPEFSAVRWSTPDVVVRAAPPFKRWAYKRGLSALGLL